MKFYVDEKKKKRRQLISKLKIYGGVAIFFILVFGAGYLIVYSPAFQIKKIDSDNQEIADSLKIFFAGQSKIAGFLGAKNILIWRKEKIADFLKNEPRISEINFEKDYFGRRITLKIKEREKFGVWCPPLLEDNNLSEINSSPFFNSEEKSSKSGRCMWFDKFGVLFAEAPALEGNLINKVNDFSGRPLEFGKSVLGENMADNLIKIFEVLEQSGLKIKSLVFKNPALQEVFSDSKPKIYFSLRFNPDFATPVIQSLKEKGLEKIEYIDFRSENRAYYK